MMNMSSEHKILGVDIGASGIKGAIVDVASGTLVSDRFRLETPKPSTPENMAKTFKKLVDHFDWKGTIGIGFPAVIKDGVVKTASNIDKSWIDTNGTQVFSEASGCKVYIQNDADAAGLAEINFNKEANKNGVVMLITIGSGLGSALFIDGKIVPNTELGHLFLKDKVAENYASDATRKKHDLSWEDWGKRFNKYLSHLEKLFWPNLFILGGGASKKFEKYAKTITVKTPVVAASLLNNAGIIGAAYNAYEKWTSAEVAEIHS